MNISARCNATLRDEVKAGILPACKPGECFVGSIGGPQVSEKNWEAESNKFGEAVIEFNTSRKALPHPGHIIRVNFCTACGNNVEKFHKDRDTFTNEMWARINAGRKG